MANQFVRFCVGFAALAQFGFALKLVPNFKATDSTAVQLTMPPQTSQVSSLLQTWERATQVTEWLKLKSKNGGKIVSENRGKIVDYIMNYVIKNYGRYGVHFVIYSSMYKGSLFFKS